MREALLVLALVACGSKKPPPHYDDLDEPPQKQHVASAESVPAGPPPACPASFAAATGSCTVEQECPYVEGTCECSPPAHCGGKVFSREQQAAWDLNKSWECTPKPPAVRADGCPGLEPGTHQACKPEGKVCEYPGCISAKYTCTNALWVVEHGEPPP